MTIVAHRSRFVIGADTHARNHVLAVVAATGEVVDTGEFSTTGAGLARAVAWAARRTGGDLGVLWAVEGVGSYGAGLARAAATAGYQVVEAPRASTPAARAAGKSDAIDAARIAVAALACDLDRLRWPRADDGVRSAVAVLLAAREHMTGERTRALNALTALLRTVDLGVDARRPLTGTQVRDVAAWTKRDEPLAKATARTEAVRLASRTVVLDRQVKDSTATLTSLVKTSHAAALLDEPGIGPVSAATVLAAWSHLGRVRSEAAFAALAGTSPVPASSGNTVRHRLNRGGDRRLNRALHTIIITRTRCDPATRAYIERRTAQGRTPKEIRRCLKRHLARHLYRALNAAAKQTPSTPS